MLGPPPGMDGKGAQAGKGEVKKADAKK
jgi:hypothetical protein